MALTRCDCLNNSKARSMIEETGLDMGQLVRIPAKPIREYGVLDLHHTMMTAASLNFWVRGYAGAVQRYMEREGTNLDGVVPACSDSATG